MNVAPSQFDLLSKSLEFAAKNHQVISHNLANVNTPGFQTQEVDFFDSLRRELRTNAPDLDNVAIGVTENDTLPVQLNGNNVDIDQQITDLDKNSLLYQAYTQLLASKISTMRTAITGR